MRYESRIGLMDVQLVLYDDDAASTWRPFTLTRPAAELLFGALTLRRRSELALGARCRTIVAHPRLRGFMAQDGATAISADSVPADPWRVYLSARAVLDPGVALDVMDGAATLLVDGACAGFVMPPGERPYPSWLAGESGATADRSDLPEISLPGRMLDHVWQLMSDNGDQIVRDVETFAVARDTVPALEQTPGVHILGPESLVRAHPTVAVEPGTVLDVRSGPIWLDEHVVVRAFTRLAGPAYIGPQSALLGGSVSTVSVGPACKIRGEVESSVLLGYANKAHDGFLGHAYVGQWVNLGALTTNSDLKNNYGTVRLWTPAGTVDTGEQKIGCLLGDHVKTGIGVMLDTGTIIEAGSSVFGAAQPPKYVPPFSWGSGSDLGVYDIDRFLATAEHVMARRGQRLSDDLRALYRAAWAERSTA